MAAYRQIHTKIWGDCWFFRLTTVEKAVFIYLFSNERACLAGLYEIPIEIIATETGVTVGEAQEILEKFAADGKAIYEDGWVWVPSLLRYNAENITSPKIQAHLHKWVAGVSGDVVLKNRWIDSYNSIVDKQYRIDTLSIPKPHEQEHEQETEQELEHEQSPQATLAALPRNLNGWLDFVREGNGKKGGMSARLGRMLKTLYPDYKPDYGRIGKAAQQLGGYSRLAHLAWMSQCYRVTGDPVSYCEAMHKGEKKSSDGKSGPERWYEKRQQMEAAHD